MDDDFFNYNRQMLFEYYFLLIDKIPEKDKYRKYYERLMDIEERIQKYIVQFDEFNDGFDIDEDEFYEYDSIDEDEYYNSLVDEVSALHDIVKKNQTPDEKTYIAQILLTAETAVNFDIETAIHYYKELMGIVYIKFDKMRVSRRLLDLMYLYLEDSIDVISKTSKIKDELLQIHTLVNMAKNDDICDAYFYMITGAVYDMMGDVNNTVVFLETAKKHLNYILKNVCRNMAFIYSKVKNNKNEAERLIALLGKTSGMIIDEIAELAIERADSYYFYSICSNEEDLKKLTDPDIYHPLKVYVCIKLGDNYFNKKNYKMAEYYYSQIFKWAAYYFEFIFYKLGNIYEQKSEFDDALENYEWIYDNDEMNEIREEFAEARKTDEN